MQSAVLLQREALTITQRNVNRTFSLLKRFIGIRNFGTIVDLEVAYWPDRLMAFGGQLEELSALSTKALWDVLDVMVRLKPGDTAFRQKGSVGSISSLPSSGILEAVEIEQPVEEKRGGTVLIASGDRDTFQLASDRTTILDPVRGGDGACRSCRGVAREKLTAEC